MIQINMIAYCLAILKGNAELCALLYYLCPIRVTVLG